PCISLDPPQSNSTIDSHTGEVQTYHRTEQSVDSIDGANLLSNFTVNNNGTEQL
ncbi:unnamed protein product, partial [Ilex paraguariensis]